MRAGNHVADRIATGALGREADGGEPGPDGGHVLDLDVVNFEAAAGRDVQASVAVGIGQIGDGAELAGRRLAAGDADPQHEDAHVALGADALRLEPIPVRVGDRREPIGREAVDVDGDAGRFDVFDPND